MNEVAIDLAASHLETQESALEVSEERPAELRRLFPEWRFWSVSDGMMPPRTVALATRGSEASLVSVDDGLAQVFASTPIQSLDVGVAERLVEEFIAMALPTSEVLTSLDEIPGLSDAEKQHWEHRIGKPRSVRSGAAVIIDGWLWDNGFVRSVQFQVAPGGISTSLGDPEPLGLSLSIE